VKDPIIGLRFPSMKTILNSVEDGYSILMDNNYCANFGLFLIMNFGQFLGRRFSSATFILLGYLQALQPRNSQPDNSAPLPSLLPLAQASKPHPLPPPKKKLPVAGVLDEPYKQLNPLSVIVVAIEARLSV
jgi:hypothetical protein